MCAGEHEAQSEDVRGETEGREERPESAEGLGQRRHQQDTRGRPASISLWSARAFSRASSRPHFSHLHSPSFVRMQIGRAHV